MTYESGIQAAVDAAGSVRALARALGISHHAILQWRNIPAERLLQIESVLDVPRHIMRPELYKGYVRKKSR